MFLTMRFMSSTSLCKPLMVGTHLFFTTRPGLAFSSGAVQEGGETGAVNVSMVVEGCAISGVVCDATSTVDAAMVVEECAVIGIVCDVMGTVNTVTAMERCAISGMEVCDVEAFTMVPLGVYLSLELELS